MPWFAVPCDHDLETIVRFVKGTKSLIVLDDCASSKTVKKRTSELVKLAFHRRHIGLSTIVITQQLTSIVKPYRINVSKAVFFYTARKDDRRDIFENYLLVKKTGGEKDYGNFEEVIIIITINGTETLLRRVHQGEPFRTKILR